MSYAWTRDWDSFQLRAGSVEDILADSGTSAVSNNGAALHSSPGSRSFGSPMQDGSIKTHDGGRERRTVGVLDDVLCNNDLFGQHKGETHITQSLDPVFPGSMYEITPLGRLELLECTYEDRSDPDAQGWERLTGCLTPVFTGKHRDINMHGWLNFPGFGRAKFTDGTLCAVEPYSGENGVTPAPIDSIHHPEYRIGEYLRRFFIELDKLKPAKSFSLSHAMSFRDEGLCVLVSNGDLRRRVYIDALDQDPSNAAGQVFQLWKTKLRKDEDIE